MYLVRQFEGDLLLKTAAVPDSNPNQVGETQIVCRFTKRLANIAPTPVHVPAPTPQIQPGCQTQCNPQTAAVVYKWKPRIDYNGGYHAHWYLNRLYPLIMMRH
jgi:hypothetical protein